MKNIKKQELETLDKIASLIAELYIRLQKGADIECQHRLLISQYGEKMADRILIIFQAYLKQER